MNLRLIRLPMPANEKGQSVVIVALFLFFVFMAFAALSIDGTIIYMHRRRLQNIADAAALAAAIELNQNKTETEAYQAAMNSITTNKGRVDWYSTNASPNPPGTNIGSGQALALGIEITGRCDVRVALRWSDVGTYFAQFVGRGKLQVGANARAACNMSGGLQPIAVKRFGDQFDWDTSPGLNTNNADVYCGDMDERCNTQLSLADTPLGDGNAYDFLKPQGVISDVITQWPGWPGNLNLIYTSPSPHADLAGGAPGREYYILGGGVGPNLGQNSYVGLVNLDIRNISGVVEYYNGVDAGTNSNTLKDLAEYHIRRGYCCDIPAPGDEVAIYNGGSTSFAAQAFKETYAVGDVVAVIVYNGRVFNSPGLELTGTGDDPDYDIHNLPTHPTTTTLASGMITYTVDLEAISGFQSAPSGLNMAVEGLGSFAEASFSNNSPILGWLGITQQTLNLVLTPTVTTVGTTTHVVTGTRIFYISAIDDDPFGTNIRRYWPAIVTIGDEVDGVQRELPSVTAYPDPIIFEVAKGDAATTIGITVDVWDAAGDTDVTVTPGSLPTGFSWNNPQPPWTQNNVDPNDHPGQGFNIKLKVGTTAVSQSTPYAIPITVSAPGMESQTFNLYVLVQEANSSIDDYVEILGYAALEVRGFEPSNPGPGEQANSVRGRIVSQLWDHPSKMTYGLRARLVPWDQ